jgi:hypothetical protein
MLPAALAAAARAHPGKRITHYFQDEARVGQTGRCCHRWWLRSFRPTGPVGRRYTFAYIFAAVDPATGRDFCLIMPAVSTAAMQEYLQGFDKTLAEDEHAVMVLDGAGWHTANALEVPANVTLLRLPPYAPELSAIERIRLYLPERHLSHRLHPTTTGWPFRHIGAESAAKQPADIIMKFPDILVYRIDCLT